MANTEIFLRNIFGTTRPNIRPLVLALNITNDLLFEQHIRTVSTIAWKHNLPLLESLSHRHLDRRLRSAEFLAVLFHAVCSDEFERPA